MVGLSKIVELVQGHNKVPVQLQLHLYTLRRFLLKKILPRLRFSKITRQKRILETKTFRMSQKRVN